MAAAPPTTTTTTTTKATAKTSNSNNNTDGDVLLVIHVKDEARGVTRDFYARKSLLVAEMEYFQSYFNTRNSSRDVDITVHCDVEVFAWLLAYIEPQQVTPTLEIKSVVSILVSSDFLRMPRLVAECLRFFHHNINDVVRLPLDLSCINPRLLRRLAECVSDSEMEEIRDRRDRLLTRLWQTKLEILLSREGSELNSCSHCREYYSAAQSRVIPCPRGPVVIDFHGELLREHSPDLAWSLEHDIAELVAAGVTWRMIYWRFWGVVNFLRCSVCRVWFQAANMSQCRYHPQDPLYAGPSASVGLYPCCKADAHRYTGSRAGGCKVKPHTVDPTPDTTPLLSVLHRYSDLLSVSPARGAGGDGGGVDLPPWPGKENTDGRAESVSSQRTGSTAGAGGGGAWLTNFVGEDEDSGDEPYPEWVSARPDRWFVYAQRDEEMERMKRLVRELKGSGVIEGGEQ